MTGENNCGADGCNSLTFRVPPNSIRWQRFGQLDGRWLTSAADSDGSGLYKLKIQDGKRRRRVGEGGRGSPFCSRKSERSYFWHKLEPLKFHETSAHLWSTRWCCCCCWPCCCCCCWCCCCCCCCCCWRGRDMRVRRIAFPSFFLSPQQQRHQQQQWQKISKKINNQTRWRKKHDSNNKCFIKSRREMTGRVNQAEIINQFRPFTGWSSSDSIRNPPRSTQSNIN